MKKCGLLLAFVATVGLAAPPATDAGPPAATPDAGKAADAGAGAPKSADAGVPFVLGGDAKKGEAKYKQLCFSCHGAKGKGDGAAATAAKLDPKPTNFTDPKNAERLTPEWVYQVIRDGGPSHGKSPLMVSWGGTLEDEDVRNLAAWVLSLKGPAKAPKKPKSP